MMENPALSIFFYLYFFATMADNAGTSDRMFFFFSIFLQPWLIRMENPTMSTFLLIFCNLSRWLITSCTLLWLSWWSETCHLNPILVARPLHGGLSNDWHAKHNNCPCKVWNCQSLFCNCIVTLNLCLGQLISFVPWLTSSFSPEITIDTDVCFKFWFEMAVRYKLKSFTLNLKQR